MVVTAEAAWKDELVRKLRVSEEAERSARDLAATHLRAAEEAAALARAYRAVLRDLDPGWDARSRSTTDNVSESSDVAEPTLIQFSAPRQVANSYSRDGSTSLLDSIDAVLAELPDGATPKHLKEILEERRREDVPKHHVLNALNRYAQSRAWTKVGFGRGARWYHARYTQPFTHREVSLTG